MVLETGETNGKHATKSITHPMNAMNLVLGTRELALSPLQADLETVVGVGDFRAEAFPKGLQCGECLA